MGAFGKRRVMKRVQVRAPGTAGFTQIWFYVEGQWKRFRCAHRAGWFRLTDLRHNGYRVVICTYRARHAVLEGFTENPPASAEEEVFAWMGQVLRGEQLALPFPKRGRRIR